LNIAGRSVIFFLAFCVASWLLTLALGRDFFPTVDAGQFLLHIRAPTGTRIEETERLADQVNGSHSSTGVPGGELGGILDNIGIPEFLDQFELQHQRRHRRRATRTFWFRSSPATRPRKITSANCAAFEPRISRHR
jgi:hypothetical protein